MSGFKALRDVSNNFEEELKKVSMQLFSAKPGETDEEIVAKKLRDLSIFTSKLRLIRAKTLGPAPEEPGDEEEEVVYVVPDNNREDPLNEDVTFNEYGEAVISRVIEQQTVKAVTQMHAVKNLITTPSSKLDPEFVEKKEQVTAALAEFRNEESQLRHLDAVLKEKEEQYAGVRSEWDKIMVELREMQEDIDSRDCVDTTSPVYEKLQKLVYKMELMRWLMSKLLTGRTGGGYNWISDPYGRLRLLKMAREQNTVDQFLEG